MLRCEKGEDLLESWALKAMGAVAVKKDDSLRRNCSSNRPSRPCGSPAHSWQGSPLPQTAPSRPQGWNCECGREGGGGAVSLDFYLQAHDPPFFSKPLKRGGMALFRRRPIVSFTPSLP
uniref:Uncharacterized protein n=1 Tax=Eutreptiella gymnastica TaxID=73025 RepID=A0A7S4FLZ2_9EUGL